MKTIGLVALLVPALATSLAAEWETVKHNGREYVTARSVKTFYGFDSMKKIEGVLELENAVMKMKLTIGGEEIFVNNVKFFLTSRILPHQDRYLISRVDLSKLLDPILRPTYIRTTTPFGIVIVDAGHGGNDSGAANRYGTEKTYNLAVARLLKKELEARRFKVVMTRDNDRALDSAARIKIANSVSNAIFLSIHFKSEKGGRVEGLETFAPSPSEEADDDQTRDSANIALAAAVHGTCLLKTGRHDGGVRRSHSGLLADVKHPAILVAGGYMSHSTEARLIHNSTYQKTLARSIAEAIGKYRMATSRRGPR